MEEKHVKKLIDGQTKTILRHQQVLLEEFQSQIKPIAEVQLEHGKKLNIIMEMVAKNTEDIDIIKGMFRRTVDLKEHEALERRVSLIEKKLRAS